MEVFLRNVPQDLDDKGLQRELLPYMNTLGITEWACDKPRRRPQGWVTFLKEADGRKFLNKHEKRKPKPQLPKDSPVPGGLFQSTGRVRDIARLHVLKTPVYVEKSTRSVDKHTLAHIKHVREEESRVSERDPEAPAITFPIFRIACGENIFGGPDNLLRFAQQIELIMVATAKFGQRALTINIFQEYVDYRLDIPYDTIQDLIAGRETQTFTIVLIEPPRMYRAVPGEDSNTKWERVGSISCWPSHSSYVATSLVYQITLRGAGFPDILRALKARDPLTITRHDLIVDRPPLEPEVCHLISKMRFINTLEVFSLCKTLPFPILFQVQALIWNNYLHPSAGIKMLNYLGEIACASVEKNLPLPFTTESMKQLFQKIPYPCPGTDPVDLDVMQLIEDVVGTELDLGQDEAERDKIYGAKISNHQAWVFKAMVTPTRVMLHGPDPESKNRVLRMFPNHSDYFLRVIFCDEDGQDLSYNPRVSNDVVFERYREVLRDGLEIADRKFTFLGFSHSSLRSHSAWFSAPFPNEHLQEQTYDSILKSLGDFRDIRVPAKCAARIGQAFSETPYAIPLLEHGIKPLYIPDVTSADGSRVFSDGVGTISWDALEEVWPYLSTKRAAPTCLQIRWGGCKGMLSLDSRLKGKVFCVRKESMMKFPSTDLTELGICDTSSKPLRLMLNRQMIKILEDMGTKNDWFLEQQKKAIDILRAVTATPLNTSTFLEYQAIGVSMGLPKLIKQLDRMGIDYRRDQFLRSAVEHVVLRELRLLKHKARIPVEQGVTLFGVMDETGFLRENEVYVAYDKTYGNNGRRINATLKDGPVLVTRSPALHPGDIQLVNHMTPPKGHQLSNLMNCIVFSQRGSRDLPSQLSGGDLDGDLYNIIWDPQAMPARVFSPADYPRVTPEPLDRPVTREDIADFFVDFMRTDVLGMIATRHVMLADKEDQGTAHENCIKLAEMHSTAVDFSKTGIPVNVKEIPRPPRIRPDFLSPAPPLKLYDIGQIDSIGDPEGDDDDEDGLGYAKHKYYPSQKILGHLYRSVDEKKIWDEDIHRNIPTDGPSVWDQLLGLLHAQIEDFDLDIRYTRKLEEAWKIRNLYESTVSDSMWHFSENPRSALSEVEVFCGFILNKRGSQTRRQRDSSIKLKEEMDRIIAWIMKLIRDRGMGNDADTASSVTGSVTGSSRWREDVVELCWACLVVGCVTDANSSRLYHGTGELQSFRVVATCCLLKEVNNLSRKLDVSAGGGYVGLGQGRGPYKTLPIRGAAGC
ncbi:hypothetical protein G7046_g4859 [Stylonectria norvegica]|nr:hypothetical protein G7046_g4859 [Stylonectria norvegica]